MQNDARLTPQILVDHGIAADQGSCELATTLVPPGFSKYFLLFADVFCSFRFLFFFLYYFCFCLKMELSYTLYSHRKIFKTALKIVNVEIEDGI